MERDDLQKIRQQVRNTYKSLEQPDFSFVKKVFSARPYDPLIKRLRDYAAVEELTEGEEDVCFSYLLKGRNCLWKLDLSIVGPYGLFVRLKSRVSRDDFLHYGTQDVVDFERKILNILAGAGIKLLTVDELSLEMPMTLFNTNRDQVRLYQALFSDRANLPWEN